MECAWEEWPSNRVMREPNVSEREAVRRYNWLVRKDKEVPVRAELAELVKQIEAWPAARTVERTIPQIHFATGIEPVWASGTSWPTKQPT